MGITTTYKGQATTLLAQQDIYKAPRRERLAQTFNSTCQRFYNPRPSRPYGNFNRNPCQRSYVPRGKSQPNRYSFKNQPRSYNVHIGEEEVN